MKDASSRSSGRGDERKVFGVGLDAQTRCSHYHGSSDIIAIRMHCCNEYYACKECHDALADHVSNVWPSDEWNSTAILCGNCKTELTIRQYLDCSNRCPNCNAGFNPGCRAHYHLYFETGSKP